MRQPITLAPLDPRDGGLRDARRSGQLGLRPSAAPPQGADPEPEPDRIHDASMSAAAYLAILERWLPSRSAILCRARPHAPRRTPTRVRRRVLQQQELVEQARRGDHDGLAVLAGAAIPRLDALARLILRNPERGKDATQEALVRAWRDLPSLRDPEQFDAWLHRLLVHACMDEARKHRRHSFEVELTPIDHPTIKDSAISIAERDALERGFRKLDPEQRALIVLHHYLDLSLPEVAETMRIPLWDREVAPPPSLVGPARCARGRRQGRRPSSRRAVSHDSARRLHPAPRHLAPRRRASR